MEDRVYLLTQQEFQLLAAAGGIRRLYGFEPEYTPPDRETSVEMLRELTGKGYILSTGQQFETAGEMKPLIEELKEAKTVLEVHKNTGRSCILYLGGGCVRVSKSLRRPELLELQRLNPGRVWEWLQEEGWIPERREGHDFDGSLCSGLEQPL